MARAVVQLRGQRAPPVDLHALAAQEPDLRVCAKDLRGECDGLLRWYGRSRRFYLYYHDDPFRQRFNLAHELAHYLIDEHCHAIRTGIGVHKSAAGRFVGDRRMEYEADVFASELLVPTPFLQDWMLEPTVAVLQQVAALFDTSLQSAALRIVENASIPAAVVVSRAGSVCWYRHNDAMLELSIWGIPAGSPIPAGTPSAAAWAQRTDQRGPVAASTWFTNAGGDPTLHEDAIALPGHQTTLTLLSG